MKEKSPSVVSFVVSKVQADQSLQMFLAARLSISKRAAKNLLDDRVVWVNRRCVWMTHHALKTGDTVELPAASLPKQSAAPSQPVLRILVQDDFYLVVDKPSNMLSVGAGSAEELLRAQTGLAALRHPVLGDREHGVKFARDPRLLTVPRQMLHAAGLELPHPMRPGETLKAHSPLPADFRRCLKLFDMGK